MASWIGYLATAFLALSLLVNNDLRFRWLNTLGCVAFIVYGWMIQAFPVMVTNTLLLVINLWYLVKVYRSRAGEDFELIAVGAGDPLVQKFLKFYAADIQSYFPAFSGTSTTGDIHFIVLRDMAIANIFIARLSEDGTAEVLINYTVPKFRDFKVGRFLFDRGKEFLLSRGVRQVIYHEVAKPGHAHYLKVVGFEQREGQWIRQL
jgi:hypothetical protein